VLKNEVEKPSTRSDIYIYIYFFFFLNVSIFSGSKGTNMEVLLTKPS
jgi:hypothetical protein